MSATMRVGTASWSDPGFVADWYPPKFPASARLSWYAQHFNLVEVNSSFYAIPNQAAVQRWCDQTPPGFLFDLKLHRLFSRHSTKPELLPPDLRKLVTLQKGRVIPTPRLESALAKRFLREIEPLSENGKLGALLLQFSPSFRPKTDALNELDHVFEYFAGQQIAVELRNRDWATGQQLDETLKFFRLRKISFVCVDGPQDSHFMVMPSEDFVTTRQLAYLRCHGRNAQGYVRGRTVAQRFDYKYSKAELEELAARAVKLAKESAEVHVVYNNNASNYAPVNAAQFLEIVGEKYPNMNTGPSPGPAEQDFPTGRRTTGKLSRLPLHK